MCACFAWLSAQNNGKPSCQTLSNINMADLRVVQRNCDQLHTGVCVCVFGAECSMCDDFRFESGEFENVDVSFVSDKLQFHEKNNFFTQKIALFQSPAWQLLISANHGGSYAPKCQSWRNFESFEFEMQQKRRIDEMVSLGKTISTRNYSVIIRTKR